MILTSSLLPQILHTVQSAKQGWVSAPRAEVRLRNVNLFLNGLVSPSDSAAAYGALEGG
jgi:hypothetical protein